MPKITKTSATNSKPKPKTGGGRDKLRKVTESGYGLRMNLYGRGKTGKTTLACDFPKPLMLVGTMGTLEDGTLSVSDVKGVEFFPLERAEEIEDVCKIAIEDGYKTIVLDTGGGLQDMILKEHLGLADVPVQRTWGMAQQKDWQVVGMQTKERLRELLNLSMTHGVNVLIVAHERNFTEDNESDALLPTVGSALSPSIAGWLNGACDYICQCFIREKVQDKVTTIAGKEVKTQNKTGKAEYCLRIGPHPVYQTGFRKPKGVELPDVIVDPSYEKIRKLIEGK